ncbi:MAG: hypothetical protein AMXMBFR56_72800 [Polyangiaceae bacterium]
MSSFSLAEILEEFAEASEVAPAVAAELWRGGVRFFARKGRAVRTRDEVLQYLRTWRRNHPEKMREYSAAWRARNIAHARALSRVRSARWRERNRDAVRARDRRAARERYAARRNDPAWMADRRRLQNERYHARRAA